MARGSQVASDLVQPFQVERAGLGGRLVRLGPSLSTMLARHNYPPEVATLLAEAIVLSALLASTVKYDGVFTLQAKGEGPVTIVVADQTSEGVLRGYAQFDADAVAQARDAWRGGDGWDVGAAPPVQALLGRGHLAFTADQGPDTERYQGIVELSGATLTDCVHHYFRQSEQIDAAIKVGVLGKPGGAWSAGAIMVRRLPGEGPFAEFRSAESEEGWREAVTLMSTVTAEELTDPELIPHALLYRLFQEPGVRVFQPRGLIAGCRCSRERVERTLAAFPRKEVLDLMEDGRISVRCEFCGESYDFDADALDELFTA